MSRLDSLRQDLAGIRRFARRLKDEEHEDPLVPALPPARLVSVPGRGEIFLRQPDGPSAGPTIVLLHGWALSADLNWFSGLYKSWVKAEIRRGDPSDIAAAGRGLSAFDARDFARDIDVPTTVVVTARDRLIRPARQRELAKAIPGAGSSIAAAGSLTAT